MSELPLWMEWIVAALLVTGGVFALVGAIGMVRFPDFYMRLHAPTKSTTLGVGGVLLASLTVSWWRGEFGVPELLIALFLFITAPVSAIRSRRLCASREISARRESLGIAADGGF